MSKKQSQYKSNRTLIRTATTGLVLICLALVAGCSQGHGSLGPPLPISEATFSFATVTTIPEVPTLVPTPDGQVTLMAVGDVMLARQTGELIQSTGLQAPFEQVSDLFYTADWVVANLECAITDSDVPEKKTYTFAAPMESALSLAIAGINVVNLSNNHSQDYGPAGMADTLEALHRSQIYSFGIGKGAAAVHSPLLLEKNGLTIALLGYTDVPIEQSSYFDTHSWIATPELPGLAWAILGDVQSDVASARQQADVVIVYFHYGIENLDHASRAQHYLATGAIDAGASLVLGSHSHRLQEIERYKGGLIVYSLGNFVFDGFDGSANLTAILSVRLGKTGVIEYSWYPMVIVDGIPQPADAQNTQIIRSLVEREYKLYLPGLEPGDISD
jgi:poly-gamma-glutamate capsule biosynthesis protein CapA/YwtB (metallophosphatase superfamily)